MANWKLEGSSVVWDEDAPDPVDEEQEGIAGIDLGSTYSQSEEGEFDPGAGSIDRAKKYVTDNPGDTQRVYDAELAGKGRQSLLDWLTAE